MASNAVDKSADCRNFTVCDLRCNNASMIVHEVRVAILADGMRNDADPLERPSSWRPDGAIEADDAPALSARVPTFAWGALGFIVGAIFWHFIGFWSFVSDVVLKGHPGGARLVAQTGHDCLDLSLDRATGKVTAVPCPLFASELAESLSPARSDSLRLADKRQDRSTRWSILISQEEDEPAAQPVVDEQIRR